MPVGPHRAGWFDADALVQSSPCPPIRRRSHGSGLAKILALEAAACEGFPLRTASESPRDEASLEQGLYIRVNGEVSSFSLHWKGRERLVKHREESPAAAERRAGLFRGGGERPRAPLLKAPRRFAFRLVGLLSRHRRRPARASVRRPSCRAAGAWADDDLGPCAAHRQRPRSALRPRL